MAARVPAGAAGEPAGGLGMRWTLLAATVGVVCMAVPASAIPDLATEMPWDLLSCGDAPDAAHVYHDLPDPMNPMRRVAVHLVCLFEAEETARGGGCSSGAFVDLGYQWASTYSARVDPAGSGLGASGVVNGFQSSGNTWDAAVGANLFGSLTQGGSGGNAGRSDGVDQLGWKRLGGSTIAQTTTWYNTQTGNAVESDGAYNTQFAWSLSGEANKMDLENIATHEFGHMYGLDHPRAAPYNTMHAYGYTGETLRRSPAVGDVNGMRSLY